MVESFNGLYETEVIHHERPCAKQPSFCEVRTDSFVLLRFLWCAPSTIVVLLGFLWVIKSES